jgi:putative endopeptidase
MYTLPSLTLKQIIEQYDQYQVLGLNVSGALTAGENIADLGGLVSSFHAMEKFLDSTNSQDLRDISGLTPQELFFVSFAQLWRAKMRDPQAIKLIKTDPHSPNKVCLVCLPISSFE